MFSILILLFGSASSNGQDCLGKMKEYMDLPIASQFALSHRQIEMSGDWANKFGLYDMCLREDNHYSTVSVMALPTPMQFLYGFCHSKICDADDFNSNEGQEMIKNYMNESFIGKVFHIDFSLSTLAFYNPVTYYPDFSWGSIITIAVIFILCCFGLFDSFCRMLNLLSNSKPTEPKGFIADFSLIKNYNKLLNLKTIDPNLAVFNGVRSLAFMMVVYGHSAFFLVRSTYQLEQVSAMKKWQFIFTVDMLYSVDVFFWLGGFFMAFVMCETKKARLLGKNPASVFIIILHRILRIWPCYILCIMMNSYLLPFAGDGPRWWYGLSQMECPVGSWRVLLFIDNFFHDWKLCFGWGWYLQCDMQLFILCLIPMMIYALGYRKITKYLIGVMIFGSLIYGLLVSIEYELTIPAKSMMSVNFLYNYYINSLTRAPTYLFGLLIGIYYREFKQKEKDNLFGQWNEYAKRSEFRVLFSILCYSFGSIIILWLYFGWKEEFVSLVPNFWPEWFEYLFAALCRLSFVIGVTLLCLPNMIGIHDVFNRKFMNNNLFKVAAKLSFAGYLLHYMVLLYLSHTFYMTPTYTTMEVIYMFVGCLVITMMGAVFLTLLVEMPFGALQVKLIDSMTKTKKKEPLLQQQ